MAPYRRRERDRPKNVRETPYDPSGRTLLRYDSDDEASPAPQPYTPAVPRAPSPERAQPGSIHKVWALMAQRQANPDQLAEKPAQEDEVHFQNGAFGLEGADEELQVYLRKVKDEAAGMKQYTTVATIPEGPDLVASVYHEASWAPRNKSRQQDEDASLSAPQIAYYQSLKKQFLQLRERLQSQPTATSLQALDDDQPCELGSFEPRLWAKWKRMLQSRPPVACQLKAMTQMTAIKAIGLVKSRFLKCGANIDPITCAWIWSLFAKLDNVGFMESEQVGRIREFARKAIIVQLSFDNPEAAAALDGEEAWDDDDFSLADNVADPASRYSEVPSSLFGWKLSVKSNYIIPVTNAAEQKSITDATRTVLDMIITITGDLYGQRDLLVARKVWMKDEGTAEEVENETDVAMNDANEVDLGDV
ncbi:hypothetical protein MBLNU230_g6721t1 [Neophaeotheca triangularis]